jgi:hypothetical protein
MDLKGDQSMRNQNNEEWEIAIGGNFLQIWEAGTYATMDILDFDNGKVAEVEMPNARKLDIEFSEAINMVMLRAHVIVRAPAMMRLLEKLAPLIEAEAEHREFVIQDPKFLAEMSGEEKIYYTEMREAVNEIRREIDRAHGREIAELDPPEDDYDYAADDRNFDAARERSWKE